MNRVSKLSRAVAVVAAFAAAPTYAIQPGQTVNPNGFPIGEHNNLNILGNNDDSLANSYATTRETLFTATSSLYR